MSFGAFRGSTTVNQSPQNRWASALDALSKGLMAMGTVAAKKDEDSARQAAEDRRAAANQAMMMNMARFKGGIDLQRAQAQAAAQATKDAADRGSRESIAKMETDARTKEADASRSSTDAYRNATLGLRSTEIGLAAGRENRADARAANAADKLAASQDRAAATAALKSTQADMSTEMTNLKGLRAQRAASDDPDEQKALDAQISASADTVKQLQGDERNLRAKMGYPSITTGSAGVSGGSATTAPKAQQAGDGSNAGALSPDQQQVFDVASKQPGVDQTKLRAKISGMSPDQVQATLNSPSYKTAASAIKPPSADTGGSPDSSDFLPPTSGAQPDPTDVLNAATPAKTLAQDAPGAPQDPNATPAPATPDPSAQATAAQPGISATPPTAPDPNAAPAAPDPSQGAQVAASGAAAPDDGSGDQSAPQDPNADLMQNLQSSPQGQGVLTTLDRLAQVGDGPNADKLRRQAQIQIGQIDPNADPDSFIDNYIQQQTQQPEYS